MTDSLSLLPLNPEFNEDVLRSIDHIKHADVGVDVTRLRLSSPSAASGRLSFVYYIMPHKREQVIQVMSIVFYPDRVSITGGLTFPPPRATLHVP